MRSIGAGSAGGGPAVSVDVMATRAAVDELREVSAGIEDGERRRVALVGRVLDTCWWQLDGARTPAAWLRAHLGVDDDTARRLLRLTEVCSHLGGFGVVYAGGQVSAAHLEVLSRAVAGRWDAARSDEAALVAAATCQGLTAWSDTCADWAARQGTADAEERYVARSLRTRTDLFGDLHGAFHLPGDDGQRVLAALDAATDPADPDHQLTVRSYPARRADALVDLVCGDGEDQRVTTTVVVVDRPLLDDGPTARPDSFDVEQRCDHQSAAISPAVAARLACDATIVDVTVDDAGLPLFLGRSRRTFTRAQRRALAARHRRCAFPDCHVAYWRCQLHHAHEWAHGGPTDIDNAVPLCRWHHHLVHDGGWTLGGEGTTWAWHPPADTPWDPITV